MTRSRLSPAIFGIAIQALMSASALAGALSPSDRADLRRAYEAAKLSTSEEPAVRAERRAREPSPGFMLGAALGAWTAAAAQLDFDLKNPTAAGPPHVSQTGADDEALRQDCTDEATAFMRLDSRAGVLGLAPVQVVEGAGVEKRVAQAWTARRAGPVRACEQVG
jgi:hypothetical protein